MAELLSSKIVMQEGDPRIRIAPELPAAVGSFIGIAERGPVGVATDITSYEEYVNIFGGFTAASELALAVRQYFLNGGRRCFVIRTLHYSPDATSAANAQGVVGTATHNAAAAASPGEVEGTVVGPFNLEPADTLVGSVGGAGDQTATFNATAAARTSLTEPFALADLQTLTVSINSGGVQTAIFNTSEFSNIATATAEEVAAVLAAELTGCSILVIGGTQVRITSDVRGTSSGVNVTGGTANGALGFTTGNIAGTGNVANIDSVTVAEIETIVEAVWTSNSGVSITSVGGKVHITTVATGASASIQVKASSTADDELGLDNATHSGSSGSVATLRTDGKTKGTYANALTVELAAATSGIASEFNYNIRRSSILVEQWPNVTMDSTLSNYIETIVNDPEDGSNLVEAVDLAAGGTPTQRRPANNSSPFAALTGGNDGLASLADADFIGDSAGQTGIRALDTKPEVTMIAIPDRATVAVQNAMITYCEVTRNRLMVAVIDPPTGLSYTSMVTHRDSLSPGASEVAAIYWPRVYIPNPSSVIFGLDEKILVAPSGSISGVYANVAAVRAAGAFTQPGGVEDGVLQGVVGVENEDVYREAVRDILYPKRINPIRSIPGRGFFLDGVRTMKGDGNFPSLGERLGVSDFERVLQGGLEFARLKNNTQELRGTVEKTARLLCLDRMAKGCLASFDPATAFFVDVSDGPGGLNKPSVIAAGKLLVKVGLATNKPAEFIIVTVSQDTRALESEIS
jgi:hypothetical protein